MHPDIEDIRLAQANIRQHAAVTPLLESPRLNKKTGGRILVKAECLQVTGSFKLRGALNRISQLSDQERQQGIIAFSSGNHAQAVAYAAGVYGTQAVILMPADAPAVKVAKTREYGAEVVFYDRYTEDRVEIGRQLANARGLIMVPPYDDPRIISGQGTLGVEVCAQAKACDAVLDAFLICCSGGGLTAGCALAFEALSPDTQVIAVEPRGFDDTRRSLAAGERLANEPGQKSVCDAVLGDIPGELTFPINSRLLHDVLVVSDDEALAAVAYAADELKIVVEPGGAIALAAVLSGKLDVSGRTIGLVCSGGNIDREVFRSALMTHPVVDH